MGGGSWKCQVKSLHVTLALFKVFYMLCALMIDYKILYSKFEGWEGRLGARMTHAFDNGITDYFINFFFSSNIFPFGVFYADCITFSLPLITVGLYH